MAFGAQRFLFALVVTSGCATTTKHLPTSVTEGHARFQVLTPSLIRLEYAGDDRFEDRPTFNVPSRNFEKTDYSTRVVDGWRELETSDVVLRYRQGSGPFAADNLMFESKRAAGKKTPFVPNSHSNNLGGWYRSLDGLKDAVPLHDGFLSRDGWYLLDDSEGAIRAMGLATEPRRVTQPYYDGYLLTYGDDYGKAYQDFARLTGRAPLLPRFVFGVWFSRYFAYSFDDYRSKVLPLFRSEKIPLDVLVVDTDWKVPSDWNGWNWREPLLGDAGKFFSWAKDEGLKLTLNLHPSIQRDDPRFAEAQLKAGELSEIEAGRFAWDLGKPSHAESYFSLHVAYEKLGLRFWWYDWCCEAGRTEVSGVPSDSWINHLYAERQNMAGLRGFAFSRIGSHLISYGNNSAETKVGPWGEHRSSIHFTGDTAETWEMLRFAVQFTVAEGNIGLSYVSHDIGSFSGKHLAEDFYVRWVQLGTFQPILRLHSNHGDRLPWEYAEPARSAATQFLRLRGALVPYLYTLARIAHDTGLPMARGLYTAFPKEEEAYKRTTQYLLGDSLLVAPVTIAGNPASSEVWFPPGTWVDFFTGDKKQGPSSETLAFGFERMPVYAKAGAILPLAPPMKYADEHALDPLLLKVFVGADGEFTLYEDEGEGLAYLDGQCRRTRIAYREKEQTLTIDPAIGDFPSANAERGYQIELVGVAADKQIFIDGTATSSGPQVALPKRSVGKKVTVRWK